ncbi:MAG: folylpolyglutamate synthase/dihydrofolate synthase family protein [Candidatus Doudnabacteria bacterium]
MNYQESKDYLYNLGYELSTKKFGLQNTQILLEALGNPQESFFKIQVAGTNGKGSTSAFLSSIATTAKIKTGLFTSPHLIEITERIRINDQDINQEIFAEHATRIRLLSEQLVEQNKLQTLPTFFEQVTAIALSIFAEQKIELAILETGLGGRFDSTTATHPEVAVFTPISLDHQNILGHTISQIAQEKAQIIHPESKTILSSEQVAEAMTVLNLRAKELNKSIIVVKTDPDVKNLSLAGEHQKQNASLAVEVSRQLNQFNFDITDENISQGLESAHHSGRLELIKNILLDGAHNLSGIKALTSFLQTTITKPITLIFGVLKDKDITKMTEILFPVVDTIFLTTVNNPRALTTLQIAHQTSQLIRAKNMYLTNTIEEALTKAQNLKLDNQIVVAGSLYLVGEAKQILEKEKRS